MNKTGIEYLTHTWNPIAMRCDRVTAGCDHCWHLTRANMLAGNAVMGDDRRAAYAGGPPVLLEDELAAPLKLRKPAVIGVQFMGDLFHESVPFEWIDRAFDVMANEGGTDHTYVILTKRLQRIQPYLDWLTEKEGVDFYGFGPSFIIGTSVENQPAADERVPLLLETQAAKRIVSYEPALGAVNFDPFIYVPTLCPHCGSTGSFYHTNPRGLPTMHKCLMGVDITGEPGAVHCDKCGKRSNEMPRLDGILCGPETGPGARPAELDWFRSARDQCAAAGVAFWYKPGELDGVRHEEMP